MEEQHFIGVDVSKNTLDMAEFDGVLKLGGHITVENNKKGYAAFLEWMTGRGIARDCAFVCMEFTGLYAHDFRKWLEGEGITYYMIPPKKMHKFDPPENTHGLGHVKTDKMDAYKIAIYIYCNIRLLTPSKLPSETFFRLKRLMAERHQYVVQKALYLQHKSDIGRFESESSQQRRSTTSSHLAKMIKEVEGEMMDAISSDPSLLTNYNLLTSVIGIGMVVAITTMVLTENFTLINNPRSYANYIAVAPFKMESGTSVKGRTRTSKEGFKQAKADLSIAVLAALRFDPVLRAYYTRKKEEGKHTYVVLNAIKFKLIERMFAVVKRGKPYIKMESYGR